MSKKLQQHRTRHNPQLEQKVNEINNLAASGNINKAIEEIETLCRNDDAELIVLKVLLFRQCGQTKLLLDRVSSSFRKNPKSQFAVGEFVLTNAICGNADDALQTLIKYCENSGDFLNTYILDIVCETAYSLAIRGFSGTAMGLLYSAVFFEHATERANAMIQEISGLNDIPLMVRILSLVYNCPDNFSGKSELILAQESMLRFQWNKALKHLIATLKYSDEWVIVLYNVAVLQFWLLDLKSSCETLKLYAANKNLSADYAVNAEALRLTINMSLLGEPDTLLNVGYKINDPDKVLEKLLSSPFAVSLPVDRKEFVDMNVPVPKGIFRILDRPIPSPDTPIDINNVSSQIGFCLLFNKTTEIDASIEIFEVKKKDQELLQTNLKNILGDLLITDLLQTKTDKQIQRAIGLFIPQFVCPKNKELNDEQLSKLQEQYFINISNPQWLKTTFESLGNKTPLEAAKEPAYKNRLQGLLVQLEAYLRLHYGDIAIPVVNHLRQTLEFPLLKIIQVQGTTVEEQAMFINDIPIWRWSLLDVKTLLPSVLAQCLPLAMHFNETICAINFAEEILKRPKTEVDANTRSTAFYKLISIKQTNHEFDAALALIEEAKNEFKSDNSEDTIWYMLELPILFFLNQKEQIKTTMKYLIDKSKNDKEVMINFSILLMQLGLIQQDGNPNPAAKEFIDENILLQQKSSELWTPDSPQEQKTSKLWTPDN
ncbi:MAG: hypothetical protein LBK06_01385 [Planctomycetaceae bacterium]|jgi:hypothetical protein|nr:hypothetical protein [Planctomycetaceae bacterium]